MSVRINLILYSFFLFFPLILKLLRIIDIRIQMELVFGSLNVFLWFKGIVNKNYIL